MNGDLDTEIMYKYRDNKDKRMDGYIEKGGVTDLPFYVFISVICWAPVDLDPREMVTPGSFNR
jgi:hypothetical protein